MDLHEFLLARIDEEEAWARSVEHTGPSRETTAEIVAVGMFPSWLIAPATGSPARVRVEVESPILAYHPNRGGQCATCHRAGREGAGGGEWSTVGLESSPCPTVRALALPYADHAEYRAEWLVR